MYHKLMQLEFIIYHSFVLFLLMLLNFSLLKFNIYG